LILLPSKDLPQDSSHDLTASSFWQIWNDVHLLRCGKWTNALSDLRDERFLQVVGYFITIFDGYEGCNSLTGKFVVNTNDSSFSNGIVLDECGFDLGG
jgi:hypothetical protein